MLTKANARVIFVMAVIASLMLVTLNGVKESKGLSPSYSEVKTTDFVWAYNSTSGEVTFTAIASGISNYTWDFGDGSIGYGEKVNHDYAEGKNYTITLIMKKDGDDITLAKYLNMTDGGTPAVDFYWEPETPTTSDMIQFWDNSTDPDDDIYNWTWDFGDGSISYERNPVHRYADDGTYDITLFVKDYSSGGNSVTKQIFVFNVPPVADFYWTRESNSIKFLDYSHDSDGSIANYTWDFGDGNISHEQNPVHNYSQYGAYYVTLTIKDDDSASNSTTKMVNTFNEIPYVNFFWSPLAPTVLDMVQFSDNSSGIDDEIVNWTWDFGDGNTSYEQNPAHQFAEKKTYTVTLTVIDEGYALNTRSKEIEIVNAPPVVNFSWEPQYPADGEAVNFTDESYDMDGYIVNYTWNFGDGNISYERNATHTFAKSGTYAINLTVRDNDGASSSKVYYIRIANIYVDDDAPPEWYDAKHVHTVQEAVNNASEGYHIYVLEGNYRENVVVDKTVIIEGENAVIDGMGAGNAITVTADKTEIKNLEVKNASNNAGMEVQADNVTIKNCVFTDSKIGLYMKGDDGKVTNSSITGNIKGAIIDGSRNLIENNNILQNTNGTDINGDGNKVDSNNFVNNIFAVEIINGDGNKVDSNNFEGNSFAIDVYTSGECSIDGNNINGNGNGIRLLSDNSTSVDNNTLNLNAVGILINGDGHRITNCSITNNNNGINIDSSYNTLINGCSFSDNGYGIYIDGSDYITVSNSEFDSHSPDGLYATNSSRIGIFGSSFNYGGVNIRECSVVEINYCNYSGGYGLSLTNSSAMIKNCTVHGGNVGLAAHGGNITLRDSEIYGNDIGVKMQGRGMIGNCSIHDNTYGIYGADWDGLGSVNITASLSKNVYGIYLDNFSYSTLENISFLNNTCGLYMKNSSYNNVLNCTLSKNEKSIVMENSQHNTLKNNTMKESSTAFEIINSRYNSISENEIKESGTGLLLSYSPLNTFTENKFNENDYGIDVEGSEVEHFYEDMDASNKVNGMSVYYIVNSSGRSINGMAGYLAMINCGNFSLNASTENNGEGILIVNSSNFSVTGSNFSDNIDGMVVISSGNGVIKNTIISFNTNDGVIFRSSHDISITNCNISSNGQRGINTYSVGKENGNFAIKDSTISFNWLGINIENVDSNKIENATIYENEKSGIRLFKSDNNFISSNRIYGNEYGIHMINSELSNISINEIRENDEGVNLSQSYMVKLFGNTLNNSDTGLYAGDSSADVTNCIFKENDKGVYARHSSLDITDCSFTNNFYGLHVSMSTLSVEKCDVTENNYGISLYSSDNASIEDCDGIYNNTYGIFSNSSSYAEIRNCSIFGNEYGLFIEDGSDNRVEKCTIYNNTDGISIVNASSSNMIFTSLIHHNLHGLNIKSDGNEIINCSFWKNVYGVEIEGKNNKIYHNNFAYNVENAFDTGVNNSWDNGYPSGGNYWSDYPGTDMYKGNAQNLSGSDGIGDIPYKVPGAGSRDNYPLMGLYENASAIPNSPPTALFSYYPKNPFSGDEISFMDRSTDPNGRADIKSWDWDFGDGNTSSEQNPLHSYDRSGVYNVSLTVEDGSGEKSSYNVSIEVLNVPPDANFSFTPENPSTSDTIQFTDESIDSDSTITNYTWDFGDGTTLQEKNPQHQYHKSGVYAVTLTVTDDSGAKSTITKKITVSNALPTAEFFFIPEKASAGEKINFTDASSDDGKIIAWHWDFGDGTASDKQNPQHSYKESGKYTITLTVKDNEGGESTITKTIEITSSNTPGFEIIALLAGIFVSIMLMKRRDKKV